MMLKNFDKQDVRENLRGIESAGLPNQIWLKTMILRCFENGQFRAQATFPRSKLIKISSPYAKQGELYRDYANFLIHKGFDLLFRVPTNSIPKLNIT